MDENLKDLDENLAWLTQKTENPKGIKETLPPHTHTHTHTLTVNVIELNCKIIKKWQPPILHQPSTLFSGLLPFLAKSPPPLSDSIFGRSDSLPLIRGGGERDGSDHGAVATGSVL